jgi:hypothetical protein
MCKYGQNLKLMIHCYSVPRAQARHRAAPSADSRPLRAVSQGPEEGRGVHQAAAGEAVRHHVNILTCPGSAVLPQARSRSIAFLGHCLALMWCHHSLMVDCAFAYVCLLGRAEARGACLRALQGGARAVGSRGAVLADDTAPQDRLARAESAAQGQTEGTQDAV